MERSRVAAEHIVHVASSVSNNFSPLDRSTKSSSSPYLSSIWFVPGLVETSFTVQDSKMHSPSWPISFLPSRGSLSLSNFHSMPYFFEGRGEVISAIPLHILIKPFPSLIDLPRAMDRKMDKSDKFCNEINFFFFYLFSAKKIIIKSLRLEQAYFLMIQYIFKKRIIRHNCIYTHVQRNNKL